MPYRRHTSKLGTATLRNNLDRMFGSERSTQHVVMGPVKTGSAPSGHVVTVSQMEYVDDIIGATSSINTNWWAINPANYDLFPQLSQMASLFTEYCFEELVFEYRPLVFDQIASSNNAMGEVALAINYDAEWVQQGNSYANKAQFDQLEDIVVNKPSSPLLLHANVGKRRSASNDLTTYYVRANSGFNNGLDTRLSDLGTLFLNVGQQQASFVLGELWVKYRVCFYKQRIPDPLGLPINQGKWRFSGSTTSSFFPTANLIASSGSLVGGVVPRGNSIYFPTTIVSANFLVTCVFSSSSSSSSTSNFTFSSNGNVIPYNMWYSTNSGDPGTATDITAQVGSNSSSQLTGIISVTVLSENVPGLIPAITLSGGTLPTGTTVMAEVFITQLDSSIVE